MRVQCNARNPDINAREYAMTLEEVRFNRENSHATFTYICLDCGLRISTMIRANAEND